MKKYLESLNFKIDTKNIMEILKRAYEKYKGANSTFWVTSLSFYTILAIVPIFAILFSLANWFGAGDYIVRQIDKVTPIKNEALYTLETFSYNLLDNTRGGLLAGVGFIFLGWTFIKMFSLIEEAFNDIWHIKKSRTLIRKISDYISFFIFIPLLFIILNGVLLFLLSKVQGIKILYYVVSNALPLVSLTIFLMSLYLVMPNTNVKIFSAFFSAIIISIAFMIFQRLFVLLQFSLIKYNAIYGSFSVVFIFLIWIRVCWFLIILGVHLSYLLENMSFDLNLENEELVTNFNSKLYIVLKILQEISYRYVKNMPLATIDDLKKVIKTSPVIIESLLEELIKGKYIVSTQDYDEKSYSIQKNIENISLEEIYNFVANIGESIYFLENEDDNNDTIENRIKKNNFKGNLIELINMEEKSEKKE